MRALRAASRCPTTRNEPEDSDGWGSSEEEDYDEELDDDDDIIY